MSWLFFNKVSEENNHTLLLYIEIYFVPLHRFYKNEGKNETQYEQDYQERAILGESIPP